jgi:hypothetical protein
VFVISAKFRPIICNTFIGPFSEAPAKFLFGKPRFEELKLENFLINDRLLTSQDWYCFMDFISRLVVENMTNQNTSAEITNGDYLLGVDWRMILKLILKKFSLVCELV